MEERNVVLVIKTRHNAQNRVYETSPEEVPTELAEMQLSQVDEKRNFHFRGVRYATEEEKAAYYKTPVKKAKAEVLEGATLTGETNQTEPKTAKAPKAKA